MRVKLNNEKIEYIECYKHFFYKYMPFIRKKNTYIMNSVNTFDSETSQNNDKDNPIAWVYQWAMSFADEVIYGRTPLEFARELSRIQKMYNLCKERKAIIYVHNLSYDILFIYQFLEKIFNEKMEFFCLNSHKILYAYIGGFEFRCSYLLSNMSLDKWCQKLNTKCKKMTGAIDYDKVIYQNDKLSIIDWQYQINDIISQKECIETEIKNNNFKLSNIPLTSTSFVRLDMRKQCRNKEYFNFFQKTRLNIDTYNIIRRGFQGGDTHANRNIVGQIVKGNIKYFDFKSLYPSVQMLDYFPSSPFSLYTDKKVNINEVREQLDTYCCIFYAMFTNLKLKKEVTVPYIKLSKILNSEFFYYDERGIKATDNGRVININGSIIMALTELDLDIILKQYDIEKVDIFDMWIADRGDIRQEYKECINKFFSIKETLTDGYFYNKSKEKLNSIYGMTATDICKPNIEFDNTDGTFIKELLSDDDIMERLEKYYNSRNNFNIYQYGIYTTAQARYRLHHIIRDIIGYENHLYNDTDSCFFIDNDNEIIKKIEEYNKKIIEENIQKGYGVKNKNNGMSYFGTFEDEKKNIKQFKTLHAKCYGYVNTDNQLSITIAGVPKYNKSKTISREEELHSLDNMKSGFTFKECGGTHSKYYYSDIDYFYNDGKKNIYASGVLILPNETTLNEIREEIILYEV